MAMTSRTCVRDFRHPRLGNARICERAAMVLALLTDMNALQSSAVSFAADVPGPCLSAPYVGEEVWTVYGISKGKVETLRRVRQSSVVVAKLEDESMSIETFSVTELQSSLFPGQSNVTFPAFSS